VGRMLSKKRNIPILIFLMGNTGRLVAAKCSPNFACFFFFVFRACRVCKHGTVPRLESRKKMDISTRVIRVLCVRCLNPLDYVFKRPRIWYTVYLNIYAFDKHGNLLPWGPL